MDTKIPIIRAYWGTSERSYSEIFPMPIFNEEYVFVWGKEACDKISKRGFKTILMSEWPTAPEYSTKHLQYYHKLEVVAAAGKMFDEFIFLDWDSYIVRPIDERFYTLLREGNEVQVPIYAYLDKRGIGIPDVRLYPGNKRYQNTIPEDLLDYMRGHEAELRKYHWKFENTLATPNFNFCYCRRPNFGNELLEVAKKHNIQNCVEENAMFMWAACTMDEYIQRYEPKVVQGTSDDTRVGMFEYDYINDPVYRINRYVDTKQQKIIYFKHI